MQTIPGWSTTAEVTSPTAVVQVDGVALDVDEVAIVRELASSLPGSTLGGSGLTAASGDVTWSQTDDVAVRCATPWAPMGQIPPRSGGRVLVDLGDERGSCRLLTGRVDDASGSVSDGVASSSLVDDIDRLNRPVTFAPLINAMPPLTDGGVARYAGMSGIWVADQVLRTCGFYATPPAVSGTVLSATMMGSAWPEVGELSACAAPTGGAFPTFVAAPWGVCAQDVNALYTPSAARVLNAPMEVMWQWPVAGESSGSYVLLTFGTATLRVVLTATQVAVQEPTGTTVLVANRGTALRAIVRFTPSGSTLGVEIRTDAAAVASGTITPASALLASPMSSVRVYAAGSNRTGAVRVSFPSSAFENLNHDPTAVFRVGAMAPHALTVLPTVTGRNALDLLREHAAAVGSLLWLDEHGRVRWVARDVVTSGALVRTLTSRDDLLDATWDEDWRDVYAGVEVAWSEVSVTRATRDSVTLWEGGGNVDTGDFVSEIIHPASGEDWIMVDTSITKAGPSGTLEAFNLGIGSFTGATLTNTTTGDESWASTSLVDTSLRRVDWRTYVVESAVGVIPSGQRAELQGPSTFAAGVWVSRWGQNLPVLRGRGRFQIATATATSTATGPEGAAIYTHRAGWWVQSSGQAVALADWIATTATVRTPQLRDVQVVFDPRLQLWDKVQVVDRDRSGLRITGLVFGIRHTVEQGSASTRLALRVLTVEKIAPSLDDYDVVWSGSDLNDRDDFWAGQTLTAFDDDPLARS